MDVVSIAVPGLIIPADPVSELITYIQNLESRVTAITVDTGSANDDDEEDTNMPSMVCT